MHDGYSALTWNCFHWQSKNTQTIGKLCLKGKLLYKCIVYSKNNNNITLNPVVLCGLVPNIHNSTLALLHKIN